MVKAFYLQLSILSLALAGLLAYLKYGLGYFSQGDQIWFGLAFFIGLTLFSYHWVASAKNKNNKAFTGRFFITMGLRLIFCLVFLLIYLISNPQRDPVFIIGFMLLYLFYTMFEIYHLVSKLRREK